MTILLLENDETDVFWFRRVLSKLNFSGTVRVVGSVSEARDYLEGRGRFMDRRYYALPNVIVSDLMMPSESGLEFLAWLKQQPGLKHIPVVILSGAGRAADRQKALDLGAVSYFTKTADFAEMAERARQILGFSAPPPPPSSSRPPTQV